MRYRLRDERGRITDTEYVIYETPRAGTLPDTSSPDTENPDMDMPELAAIVQELSRSKDRQRSLRENYMLIERRWAMPSPWTFTIKPIRELLEEEMTQGLWVDPFAGKFSPATVRNDFDPRNAAEYHLDALYFLAKFADESVDGILFDPPYSPRQVRKCYNGISGNLRWDGKTTFWSHAKNECARILHPGGKVLCFGWNSMGLGKKRGFEIRRVFLVPHDGSRNDTICTVEIKHRGG